MSNKWNLYVLTDTESGVEANYKNQTDLMKNINIKREDLINHLYLKTPILNGRFNITLHNKARINENYDILGEDYFCKICNNTFKKTSYYYHEKSVEHIKKIAENIEKGILIENKESEYEKQKLDLSSHFNELYKTPRKKRVIKK
jgi:hypothetical protein